MRVYTVAASGNVLYAGGSFLAAGGEFRNYLAGIPFSRSAVTPWNPAISTAGTLEVRTLSDGSEYLIAGGEFATVGGIFQPYLTAFNLRPSMPLGLATLTAGGNAKYLVFDGDSRGSKVEVQANSELTPGGWTAVQTGPVNGLGSTFEDTTTKSRQHRSFRAVVKP